MVGDEVRLAEVSRTMTDSLHGTATRTARSLGELQQRLETIDKAQANARAFAGEVLAKLKASQLAEAV